MRFRLLGRTGISVSELCFGTMVVSADQLQRAVESQHSGKTVLVSVDLVKEVWQGKTVWEGTVHVFDLEGPS